MEQLHLVVGEDLVIRTQSGDRLDVVVANVAMDGMLVQLAAINNGGLDFITVGWKDGVYKSLTGVVLELERPIYVNAVVKKLRTDDGLMSFEDHVQIGDVYRMKINSMEEQKFTCLDDGTQHSCTMATFYSQDGAGGRMPVELFKVEMS